MEAFDLIVRNGTIVDPSQGMEEPGDIGVRKGRVAEIGRGLTPGQETKVLDVAGRFVCPGLIDIHTHVYPYVTTWGVEADPTCLAKGVTTAVDAGSASWTTFPGFRELSVKRSRGRVLGYVHISGLGLVYGPVGEMVDMRYACPEETAECIEENRDIAVGVKVREGGRQVGSNGVEPLKMAVKAAELSGTSVMVHLARGVPLEDILAVIRPGDVATHCYHGGGDSILDDSGKLLPEVVQARKNGILFDVGHGAGSCTFDTVRSAFEQHFFPDLISSDLHTFSLGGPVFDLITTMSKFLYFGMSLREVIEKTTIAAARAIGREDTLGSLAVGRPADMAVLDFEEGEFEFMDVVGTVIKTDRRLRCHTSVIEGEVIDPAAFASYRPRDPKPTEWALVSNLKLSRPEIYKKYQSFFDSRRAH